MVYYDMIVYTIPIPAFEKVPAAVGRGFGDSGGGGCAGVRRWAWIFTFDFFSLSLPGFYLCGYMSITVSVSFLCLYVSVYLAMLSIYLSIHLSIYLCIYLVYIYICPIYQSISINLLTYLPIYAHTYTHL